VAKTENIRSSHWKFVNLTLIGGVNIMRKLLNKVTKFRKDEDGAALVEYVVILGVILAVSLTVLVSIGTNANVIFSKVNNALSTAAG
jgi:pilus assembly protein Flp/PilA